MVWDPAVSVPALGVALFWGALDAVVDRTYRTVVEATASLLKMSWTLLERIVSIP